MFGGSDKDQTVTNRVDYKRMVKDAEAAGFNPLTALRNGGAAGFTTTTTPGLSGSAVFANAIGGAAQSFLANFDPFADRRRETEFRLAEAQIANLNADTRIRLGGFGMTPAISGGSVYRPMGRPAQAGLSGSGLVPPGIQANLPGFGMTYGTSQPQPAEQTASNPFPHGSGMVVAGNVPDLETGAEARYGDFVSIPFGLLNLGADVYANFRKFRPDPLSQANTREMQKYQDKQRKLLRQVTSDPFAAWGY